MLPLDELNGGLHAHIHNASLQLLDEARAQGDAAARRDMIDDENVERIPELAEVLVAPTLTGALTGLLGDGWVLHPHRFMHTASRSDQGWHKDSGLPWGQRKMRSHRPNWLIVMYYPQETTFEMGPTEVLPGTQYWTVDHEDVARPRGEDVLDPDFSGNEDDPDESDRRIAGSTECLAPSVAAERLVCPAGTVAVLHFDLFHRATRRAGGSEPRRFAFKFWYGRATERRRPTWEHRVDAFAHIDVRDGMACLWQDVWDWMRGRHARRSVVPVDAATLA
ncbi:MAG: phytanoyl-CoA dioxygenase family protein, partial [Myxococcota bacterium]